MIWTARLIAALFCAGVFGSIAYAGWGCAAARDAASGAFVLLQPFMLAIRARQ